MKTAVQPTDGMVITESTRLAPGVFVLPNGMTIGADNVTIEGDVEGDGTLIVSPTTEHAAIKADGRQNVRVQNLSISGFYHGVRFDHCRDVFIENVKVRETWEVEGIDTFLYLWLPIDKVYGAAVLFHDVDGGSVKNCDLQHQLNGVLLYGSTNIRVEKNNASFNSGWGVYLSNANDCIVADNQLDFCNRVYRRPENGSIRVEADAAAIVMVKGSSRNRILRNSCLCGGDGIFVAGYEHPGVHESCSDNLFEDNDCRLSPNNAIESTFSRGNIFRRNDCSRSNYGFWMGYSWDNVLENNVIEFNRWVGIAAEHAHGFVIRNNQITLNGEGVRLWSRGGGVIDYFPGYEVTYDVTFENNKIEGNRIGFNAYTGEVKGDQQVHDLTLTGNTIKNNRVGVQFERTTDVQLNGNDFADNVIAAVVVVGDTEIASGENQFSNNAAQTAKAETRHT